MATNHTLIGGFQVNRGMLTVGAALTGIGALVGLTGTALVCVALANAGRGWIRQLETHPAALAQRTVHQAKAASAAGLEAWRASAN
ncbi:hypothetical protein [Kitasatospora sp. NPDC004531]